MKKIIIFLIFIFITRAIYAAPSFIVHSSNPVSTLTKSEVKKIFTGESFTWEDESEIQVVDYKKGVKVKESFVKDFLQVSPFYLYKKWIKASLQGNNLPIKLFDSSQDAINFIKNNPNAIGYLYNKSHDSNEVKILQIKVNE